MTQKWLLANFTILAGLGLTVPGYGQMGMMGPGQWMMNMSMLRHHFVMMNGIDRRYVSKENPLKPAPEIIDSGKKLYLQHCASCHGQTGAGDGEAGRNLNPRPANIAALTKMPMASDGYLYWTIAEGGIPLGTAMPPFKSRLKEEEVWKIITYLRGL